MHHALGAAAAARGPSQKYGRAVRVLSVLPLSSVLGTPELTWYSPAAQWTADNVPGQTGWVCMHVHRSCLRLAVAIVPGGNSGIGLEMVRALLTKHAIVYIAARTTAGAAIDAFRRAPSTAGEKVTFLPLDLGSSRSIKGFVRTV